MKENESLKENSDFLELQKIILKIEEVSSSENLTKEEFSNESSSLVEELLSHLKSDLHLQLSPDVTATYGEMSRENLLARVENVTRVIECVTTGKPILVGKGDSHYANSVTSDFEGLGIAMSEADAIGPVRILVGLDLKALVGFKNDHLNVNEIDDSEFDMRNTSLRKSFCRHVEGEIRREDIKHMVMRIPRRYFPEGELLSDEKKMNTPFIFRAVKF